MICCENASSENLENIILLYVRSISDVLKRPHIC